MAAFNLQNVTATYFSVGFDQSKKEKRNMSTITLVVIPGPGARTVILPENATVQDLVVQENLHGRDIIIDGQAVLPINFATTQVSANSEVFATGSVKGN